MSQINVTIPLDIGDVRFLADVELVPDDDPDGYMMLIKTVYVEGIDLTELCDAETSLESFIMQSCIAELKQEDS